MNGDKTKTNWVTEAKNIDGIGKGLAVYDKNSTDPTKLRLMAEIDAIYDSVTFRDNFVELVFKS